MSSSNEPSRVGFKVVYASSSENGHPESELEYNSTKATKSNGRGWQSARFCDYPQQLIFELSSIIDIKQIQILSHQSKIASKIEIWVGINNNSSHYSNIKWNRLGYLSLDKNERSNWKARELKSVYIDTSANYIKLAMHESHLNTINLFNQVGIVAVNILAFNNQTNVTKYDTITNNNSNTNKNFIKPKPSLMNETMDTKTTNKIRELMDKKIKAVEREDYDEAKQCKFAIERLTKASKELIRLEKEKRIAVQNEDYDKAKLLKIQIERLREVSLNPNVMIHNNNNNNSSSSNQSMRQQQQQQFHNNNNQQMNVNMMHQQQPNQHSNNNNQSNGNGYYNYNPMNNKMNDISQQMQQMNMNVHQNQNSNFSGNRNQQSFHNQQTQPHLHSHSEHPLQPINSHNNNRNRNRHIHSHSNSHSHSHSHSNSPPLINEISHNSNQNISPMMQSNSNNSSYDNRAIRPLDPNKTLDLNSNPFGNRKSNNNNSISPMKPKSYINPDNRPLNVGSNDNSNNNNNMNNNISNSISQSKSPINGNSNSSNNTKDGPPKLKASVRKDCEHLIEMFGEYPIQCLFSNNWNHRMEGLNSISNFLDSSEHPDERLVFKLVCKCLSRAFDDKVAHVFILGIDVYNKLMETYSNKNNIKSEDLLKYSHNLILQLVNALGHSNSRIVDSSGSMLITLCHSNNIFCRQIYIGLCRKMKRNLPKHLKGRGVVLLELVSQFKVPKQINISVLMDLIKPQLLNKNGNVRDIGVQITTELYQILGNKLIPFIEEIANDFLKKTLNEAFYNVTGKPNVLHRDAKSHKEQTRPSKAMNRTQNSNSNSASNKSLNNTSNNKNIKSKNNNNNLQRQKQKQKQQKPKRNTKNIKSPQRRSNDNGYSNNNNNMSNNNAMSTDFELEDSCNFCGYKNPSFAENEENLDLHYWQSCPMLTSCMLCEQVIEIPTLFEHILMECEEGINKGYVKCKKCDVPYSKEEINNHLKQQKCIKYSNRCTLCLNQIQMGEEGWRKHLLMSPGCPKNDRPLMS